MGTIFLSRPQPTAILEYAQQHHIILASSRFENSMHSQEKTCCVVPERPPQIRCGVAPGAPPVYQRLAHGRWSSTPPKRSPRRPKAKMYA